MKRILACLAALALSATAFGAQASDSSQAVTPSDSAAAGSSQPTAPAQASSDNDPIGDILAATEQSAAENAANWNLKATLYHAGRRMSSRDSLGCRVSPMRTVAIDPSVVGRHSIIFIKETVGLPMDGGGVHDGYWYASDVGGAIKGDRIDLYTGSGSSSMRPLEALNLKILTVTKVGEFSGCPPVDGGVGMKVADAR